MERGGVNGPLVDACMTFCYTGGERLYNYLERNERGMKKVKGKARELWLDFLYDIVGGFLQAVALHCF